LQKVFYIFHVPLLSKKYFKILPVKTSLRLIALSACICSTLSFLLLVKAAEPCFPLIQKTLNEYDVRFVNFRLLRGCDFKTLLRNKFRFT
jgi:hypothetical protein